MYFLSQFRSDKITLGIKLLNKGFKTAGFFQYLLKDFTELFDLFDRKSRIGVSENVLDFIDEIFGSLQLMEDIETF